MTFFVAICDTLLEMFHHYHKTGSLEAYLRNDDFHDLNIKTISIGVIEYNKD